MSAWLRHSSFETDFCPESLYSGNLILWCPELSKPLQHEGRPCVNTHEAAPHLRQIPLLSNNEKLCLIFLLVKESNKSFSFYLSLCEFALFNSCNTFNIYSFQQYISFQNSSCVSAKTMNFMIFVFSTCVMLDKLLKLNTEEQLC